MGLNRIVRVMLLSLLGGHSLSLVHAEDLNSGEKLFIDNCAECHQADGLGIAGIYPALAGNEVVRGSGVDVALVLIIGRGEMPSFSGFMPNEELASIINYIRNAWGNQGTAIDAETIAGLQ